MTGRDSALRCGQLFHGKTPAFAKACEGACRISLFWAERDLLRPDFVLPATERFCIARRIVGGFLLLWRSGY
jgi:hypothetical protein